MTSKMDLEIYKYSDTTLKLTIKNEETGALEDITSWTIFFTAKEDFETGDSGADISIDTTSHTNPTAGETEIVIADTDLSSVDPGAYYYDIKVLDDDANVYVIYEGNLLVKLPITRRVS